MSLRVGVIGAGTMGRGIAEACLVAGHTVSLLDSTISAAAQGVSAISKSLERGVERGRIEKEDALDMRLRLTAGSDMGMLAEADVIIEAVFEDMDVKKGVLRDISEVVAPGALIGSNTSSLSISQMAAAVDVPSRFVGIHFFNPVPVMKLVEIVPGEATSPETVDRAVAFATEMKKTPVVVRESPGFIVNRLLCPLMNEAAKLVMDGVARPEDIDVAMKLGANHPIGPLALSDMVGIDVLFAIMQTLMTETGNPQFAPCPLLGEMISEGRLGRKTGRGFFDYNL